MRVVVTFNEIFSRFPVFTGREPSWCTRCTAACLRRRWRGTWWSLGWISLSWRTLGAPGGHGTSEHLLPWTVIHQLSETTVLMQSLSLSFSLSGLAAVCQRSGMWRIHRMWVNSLSALTCPGTRGLTSSQFSPMTFTKFSKSPKLPKNSDNMLG